MYYYVMKECPKQQIGPWILDGDWKWKFFINSSLLHLLISADYSSEGLQVLVVHTSLLKKYCLFNEL